MIDTIHQIIVDSVSSGFWRFVGIWLMTMGIIAIPAQLINVTIARFFKHRTIRQIGYPPAHCDSDGDFLKEES